MQPTMAQTTQTTTWRHGLGWRERRLQAASLVYSCPPRRLLSCRLGVVGELGVAEEVEIHWRGGRCASLHLCVLLLHCSSVQGGARQGAKSTSSGHSGCQVNATCSYHGRLDNGQLYTAHQLQ